MADEDHMVVNAPVNSQEILSMWTPERWVSTACTWGSEPPSSTGPRSTLQPGA